MVITLNTFSIHHISLELSRVANMKLLDKYLPDEKFPWVTTEYTKSYLLNKFILLSNNPTIEQTYDYHLLLDEFMRTLNI
jgi:hypothetical protein